MGQIIEVTTSEALETVTRSEIDMQIATAKQYPRNVKSVLERITEYATIDEEAAADCFYALKRGAGREAKTIEGASVRLAEIIASCWGNLRIGTRLVGNDGKTITAQGICHDLESNVCVQTEVKRRIVDKEGRTYSEDMQVVTGNAASAIAFRNAVFKVIPKALTKQAVSTIKQVALGQANDIDNKRRMIIEWFAKIGVTTEEILRYCEVSSVDKLDADKVMTLRGTANAIKEGTTTVQETFRNTPATHVEEKKAEMRQRSTGATSDNMFAGSVEEYNRKYGIAPELK